MISSSPILETIHGSRLYGLHDKNSDYDYYKVIDNSGYTTQNITDSEDTVYVTLNDFLRHVANGVPQALEALWSPYVVLDPNYSPMIDNLRPSIIKSVQTYRRAINNFSLSYGGRTKVHYDRQSDRTKRKFKIHAMRLTLNLDTLVSQGKFDPTLSQGEAFLLKDFQQSPSHYYVKNLTLGLEKAMMGCLDHRKFLYGQYS